MSIQQQAAAIWKWGSLYPSLWPRYREWSAELYRRDRRERGVE